MHLLHGAFCLYHDGKKARCCKVLAAYLPGGCYVLRTYGDVASTVQVPCKRIANRI
jgi:hypothetical protein